MPCRLAEVLPNYTVFVTAQKIVLFIVTAVGTSNPTYDIFISQSSPYIHKKSLFGIYFETLISNVLHVFYFFFFSDICIYIVTSIRYTYTSTTSSSNTAFIVIFLYSIHTLPLLYNLLEVKSNNIEQIILKIAVLQVMAPTECMVLQPTIPQPYLHFHENPIFQQVIVLNGGNTLGLYLGGAQFKSWLVHWLS
jgi:hypothetical protein